MSAPFTLPVEDDPFNFALYADPYPNYRRVRETTPVYWSQLLHSWVLTRHADVKAALLDKRLSAARTRDVQAAQLSEDLRRQLVPFTTLLRRLGDLHLASDIPVWRPAFGVRSLETLPVTFSKVEP